MKSFRLAAVLAMAVSVVVLLVSLSGCSKTASASTVSGTNASGGSRPAYSGSHSQWNGSRPSGTDSGSGNFNSSARAGRESQMLSSLVSDGTITQAQADAVVQKLFSFGGGNQSDSTSDANQSTSSQ